MGGDTAGRARETVDAVYRSDSRRVLATLIRLLGDFDLAEEALHDAFTAAVEQWPRDGVPANPKAWLVSAGRFKAIDSMRRRARFDASLSEAIRLGRLLVELLPEPEAIGLLALMLLHDARRPARTTMPGELVLLEEQDRSLWNRDQIAKGAALVKQALSSRRIGPYTLQAAIAAVHGEARDAVATDWAQIVGLYDVLMRVDPSPVVELNRAAAVAMRDDPQAGLELVDVILARGDLEEYHLAHSARADLCRRLGMTEEARASYRRALELTRQEPERRFLERRLDELTKRASLALVDPPTSTDERVRRVAEAYDRAAEKYAEARAPVTGSFHRLLDRLVEPLSVGASVLDVGCGHGVPARYLVDRGFRVTGVDGSARLLELARRGVPAAIFLRGDMRSADPGGPFDAILAWDSVFHVPREDHAAVFARFRSWLEPGGRLLVSLGASGGEDFTSEMVGETFFYSGHAPETSIELLKGAGFQIEHWEVDDPSSRGHIAILGNARPLPGHSP